MINDDVNLPVPFERGAKLAKPATRRLLPVCAIVHGVGDSCEYLLAGNKIHQGIISGGSFRLIKSTIWLSGTSHEYTDCINNYICTGYATYGTELDYEKDLGPSNPTRYVQFNHQNTTYGVLLGGSC